MRPRFLQIGFANGTGGDLQVRRTFRWDRDEVIEGLMLAPVDNSTGVASPDGANLVQIDSIRINGRQAIAHEGAHPSVFYPSRLRNRLHVPVRHGSVLELALTLAPGRNVQAVLVTRPVMDESDWKRETFFYRLSAQQHNGAKPLHFTFEQDYQWEGLVFWSTGTAWNDPKLSWQHVRYPHASDPAVRSPYRLATRYGAVVGNSYYHDDRAEGFIQLRSPAEEWRTPMVFASNVLCHAPWARLASRIRAKRGSSFDVIVSSRFPASWTVNVMTVGEHIYA